MVTRHHKSQQKRLPVAEYQGDKHLIHNESHCINRGGQLEEQQVKWEDAVHMHLEDMTISV